MSNVIELKQFVVQQRRPNTGCIPTAYEIILRAAGITGVDYPSFQDTFDLDRFGGPPQNDFGSVANAISNVYPFISFRQESFSKEDGAKKLARIEELLAMQKQVAVSLTLHPSGGWHIMVVLDVTGDYLTLLHHVDTNGDIKEMKVSKSDFVKIHDEWPGGEQIAYLFS